MTDEPEWLVRLRYERPSADLLQIGSPGGAEVISALLQDAYMRGVTNATPSLYDFMRGAQWSADDVVAMKQKVSSDVARQELQRHPPSDDPFNTIKDIVGL